MVACEKSGERTYGEYVDKSTPVMPSKAMNLMYVTASNSFSGFTLLFCLNGQEQ